MIRLQLLVLFLSAGSAFAYPNYLGDFQRDPFRRPEADGCITCHMSAEGGDARNAFGLAFERSGMRFTTLMRASFPDRFAYPTSRGANGVVIHFADPANRQIVVENTGVRMLVDVEAKTLDGNAAAGAAGGAAAAQSTRPPEIPVDPFAREGAFFGMHVVNLPNGKPIQAGGVDILIGHRFSQSVSDAGLGGLFGFDSSPTVAFGGRVGVTDRWSVGIVRTEELKIIELSSVFNITRQGDSAPLTFAMRGGVEGRNNFHDHYSPFLQPIATRTFADRVSFTIAPTFAFNTRSETSFIPPEFRFGEEHNDTVSLGIGTGIRIFPTTSIVGEYIPRLWGFRGEIKDRPGVSMGLQKSTYRHTFEFVVARQMSMTTSQYAVQGDDLFKVGFNIYRRVR